MADFKAMGRNVRIYPGAVLIGAEHIEIGDNTIIDSLAMIVAGPHAPVRIGSWVHVAAHSLIAGGPVELDDFAGISAGVKLMAGSDDYLGEALTNPAVPAEYRKVKRATIRLGKHAVVGMNSVVMPGCELGEGVAIGACSFVKNSIAKWEVWAGTPARFLHLRKADNIRHLEAKLRSQCSTS